MIAENRFETARNFALTHEWFFILDGAERLVTKQNRLCARPGLNAARNKPRSQVRQVQFGNHSSSFGWTRAGSRNIYAHNGILLFRIFGK